MSSSMDYNGCYRYACNDGQPCGSDNHGAGDNTLVYLSVYAKKSIQSTRGDPVFNTPDPTTPPPPPTTPDQPSAQPSDSPSQPTDAPSDSTLLTTDVTVINVAGTLSTLSTAERVTFGFVPSEFRTRSIDTAVSSRTQNPAGPGAASVPTTASSSSSSSDSRPVLSVPLIAAIGGGVVLLVLAVVALLVVNNRRRKRTRPQPVTTPVAVTISPPRKSMDNRPRKSSERPRRSSSPENPFKSDMSSPTVSVVSHPVTMSSASQSVGYNTLDSGVSGGYYGGSTVGQQQMHLQPNYEYYPSQLMDERRNKGISFISDEPAHAVQPVLSTYQHR
ncbi:hypothetical protein HDU97_000130 [Phlyctochytrium planicorne]|nr:hypothetical protein HDU97_000130 [Phlyctochytrium planicorne]